VNVSYAVDTATALVFAVTGRLMNDEFEQVAGEAVHRFTPVLCISETAEFVLVLICKRNTVPATCLSDGSAPIMLLAVSSSYVCAEAVGHDSRTCTLPSVAV
jgi:hypothetical protein